MSSQSAKSTGGDSQNNAWAKRCEFWQAKISHPTRRKLNSSIHRQPLVLTGHGVSLRVEAGSLSIKNGFTHYPQKQESFRFFPGDLDLPTRIVLLDVSGGISFDVLNWLSTQQVPLIQLNWQGEVICVSSQSGHSTNPYRVEWQRETRGDHTKRMEFCNSLIAKKIDGTIVTLEKSIPRSVSWEKAMQQAYQTLAQIEHSPPRTVGELRVLEANAAATYFRAWRGIPIKWRGITRRPIPEIWKMIGQRSSPFHAAGSRNASHPLNAMLNYAYTVLESRIRIKAVTEGYDPTIGIMHEPRANSSAFIYDLMEPERARVDRAVLDFVRMTKFDSVDFIIRSDGICRINPRLCSRIVELAK